MIFAIGITEHTLYIFIDCPVKRTVGKVRKFRITDVAFKLFDFILQFGVGSGNVAVLRYKLRQLGIVGIFSVLFFINFHIFLTMKLLDQIFLPLGLGSQVLFVFFFQLFQH